MFVPSDAGAWCCLYLNVSGAAKAANHGPDVIRVHHNTGRAIELICVFEYPSALVLHPAGFAAAQRTMKVAGACGASEGRCVLDAETSTGGDLNSSGSEFNQPRQPVRSGQDITFATRGKDTSAARGDNVFESLLERGGVVEGTMKGDFKRRSQIDELACAFNVHRAVGAEDAENEATGSESASVEEIFTHECELVIRVEEVAASRPQ
jgi:hypothetical protein